MTFEQILKMSQGELKYALAKELRNMGYRAKACKKYLYAKGKVPVLLVAHMDTVHKTLPTDSTLMRSLDGRYYTCFNGLGGDDRCGVWIILQILKKHKCHVLFCEDEEIGGIGARAFAISGIKPKVNYIVGVDRRGSDDAVFYDCDNAEFVEFVEKFGFKETYGSFSDISIIAPALGIAAVNISSGYYNEHSKDEYADTAAMANSASRVCKMVGEEAKRYEYVERLRSRWSCGLYDDSYYYNFHAYPGRDAEDGRKRVSVIPESAYVFKPNGELVDDASAYVVDVSGKAYEWLYAYDVAVETDLKVIMSGKKKSAYDAKNAFWCEVVTEDEAYELMEQDYALKEKYAKEEYVSLPTWKEVRSEYGQDEAISLMEDEYCMTGEYPQWEDTLPNWLMQHIGMKGEET